MPARVRTLARGRAVTPVWRNQLGGLTFEVQSDARREFIKWAPTGSDTALKPEIARLRWAASYMDVPKVLDYGSDDAGTWLITEGVPGYNAVCDRWKAEPKTAVIAIGEGLRALHDTLPVNECPFSWTAETRLAEVHRLAAQGRLGPAHWHPEHQALDVRTAVQIADQPPPIDKLVVCHGDACAPNTLIGDDGNWTGHVDFGSLGVADRWADLAIATWSTQWNYGPGWERRLLDAYGIDPDPIRTAYYRLLWDLGP
ncbi:aminoglycoside 3'-phosphotransferase [Saccharopolyspora phatthalungensis]|uniref:Kanamycin kinase n=1 Tax=Saccharopolyspora phatthalungensis TaxID=664693 RepID=A0A840Q394_9PSEU|nr:aminoglycoside 3'-phosphotransferase [Saccharopolyspora phatthalungensis]MBB5154966.1 kanamycin kinase [Saccharopolyspora phatthalungensis]